MRILASEQPEMLLRVLCVVVPSLFGSTEGSFTREDRQETQRGVTSRGTASSFEDATSSRDVTDQRMAHWESRARINFDDTDGQDAEQISYPFILEEPSQLRLFPSFGNRVRTTGSNFKAGSDARRNAERWKPGKPDRTIEVSNSEPPSVAFTGDRRVFGVSSEMRPEIEGTRARCPRTTIQDRLMQEPLSVEEPGWILIDLTRDNAQNQYNQEDPFYVARGRRSATLEERRRSSGTFSDANVFDRTARKKRDAFVESPRRYLLEGERSSLVSSSSTERRDRADQPLSPRNKHSDIFDILNEPFFISRGKKSSTLKTRIYPPNRGYSRARLNFETTRRILDASASRRLPETSRDPRNTIYCSRTNQALDRSFESPRRFGQPILSTRTDPYNERIEETATVYGQPYRLASANTELTKITDNY